MIWKYTNYITSEETEIEYIIPISGKYKSNVEWSGIINGLIVGYYDNELASVSAIKDKVSNLVLAGIETVKSTEFRKIKRKVIKEIFETSPGIQINNITQFGG